MSKHARIRGAIIALSVAYLSGCASPLIEAGQPSVAAGELHLSAKQSVGQSFMAYQGGLEGVEFQLSRKNLDVGAASGTLEYVLRHGQNTTETLATGVLSTDQIRGDWLRVSFPPQSAQRRQDYFVLLTYRGSGGIDLRTGPASAYPNGAAYVDDSPQEAQLTFRLLHEPLHVAGGLIELAGQWLFLGLVAASLLLLPGIALQALLPARITADTNLIDKLLLAPGLSVGVYPLLIMFSGLLGAHWGALYAWMPIGVSLLLLLVRSRRRMSEPETGTQAKPQRFGLQEAVLLGVIGLIIFTRLWPIRALEAPMWRDSYQHSVLTQLLIENGGLFDNWQPYADMLTLTYHIGFHSISAALGWIAGLPGSDATLWMGQFLNVAAVVGLFPVVRKMTRSTWAGTIAVAFAGLISEHPGYYLNWGRYTQLTGQVVVLGLIWMLWTTIESARSSQRREGWIALVLVTALTWAGLALSHYRVLILSIMLFAVMILMGLIVFRMGRVGFLSLVTGAVLGAVLFLPWLVRSTSGTLTNTATDLILTPSSQASDFVLNYNGSANPLGYFPEVVRIGFVVICALGLLRRNKSIIAMALWMLSMIVIVNPQFLGLGGAGIVTNFALSIFTYIPVSLMLGAGLAEINAILLSLPSNRLRIGIQLATCAGIAVACLMGAGQRINDIQPSRFLMLLRPDRRAADWIKANIPETAKFLVNSYPVYDGSLISGSDGGWWLPLMANRATTQPPINYSMEKLPTPDYLRQTAALPVRVRHEGLTAEILSELKSSGVTHIYVGQLHNDADYIVVPHLLEANPALALVYRQDRVWIFKIEP